MKKCICILCLLLITFSLVSCQKSNSTNSTLEDSKLLSDKITPPLSSSPTKATTQSPTPITANVDYSKKFDFTIGASNSDMNFNRTKIVTDGTYLYAYIPSSFSIYKCLLTKGQDLMDARININDGGIEKVFDVAAYLGNIDSFEALGYYNNSLYVVIRFSEYNMDQHSIDYSNYKAVIFKIDGSNNVESVDEFYKGNFSGMIVGKWYYYTSQDLKADDFYLYRRSLLDGKIEKLESSKFLTDFYFTEDKLYFEKYIDDTHKANYVMDLSTMKSQEIKEYTASSIRGIYDGMIYFQDKCDIMRMPIQGGAKELVLSNVYPGPGTPISMNFASNDLYFTWGNLFYKFPLDKIGLSRYDINYTHLYQIGDSKNKDSESGLWIWGDNIWTYCKLEGDTSLSLKVYHE